MLPFEDTNDIFECIQIHSMTCNWIICLKKDVNKKNNKNLQIKIDKFSLQKNSLGILKKIQSIGLTPLNYILWYALFFFLAFHEYTVYFERIKMYITF